jgi:chemotaxis protein MotB
LLTISAGRLSFFRIKAFNMWGDILMTNSMKRQILVGPVLSALVLTGCVSQSKYDALSAQNQQCQQQVASLQAQVADNEAQISRLQGAIKYTVNSDLLFASGSWQMSARGQQLIARLAQKLAPLQQNKILVNGYTDNKPIGAALQQQGITSNQILSQKRAEAVMQYLVSQGVKPDLVSAHGYGSADPVASNDTAQGRVQNRRVELTLGQPAGSS